MIVCVEILCHSSLRIVVSVGHGGEYFVCMYVRTYIITVNYWT